MYAFIPFFRVLSLETGAGLKAARSFIKSAKFCPPFAVPENF